MSNIEVNTDILKSYGETLDSKAASFIEITNTMKSIVDSLSSSWDGYDAQNFISNAHSYLSNLKVIEQSLLTFGNSVKNHSVSYGNRCVDFYNHLG